MSVARARKPKKSKTHRPTKTPFEIIKTTNYVNLAIMIRTLYEVYGWREKRIAKFLECYLSLMQEIADKRNTPTGLIKDTKDLTRIDVVKLIDELY